MKLASLRRRASCFSLFCLLAFHPLAKRAVADDAIRVVGAVVAVSEQGPSHAPLAIGGVFTITRQSLGSGAIRANGGGFELTGTLGQAVVGPSQGAARLDSGFHIGARTLERIFRDGFELQP